MQCQISVIISLSCVTYRYVLGNPACEKEWYVGTMERNECEKMVMAAGKCDYLVRLASDMKNYAIVINQVGCALWASTQRERAEIRFAG